MEETRVHFGDGKVKSYGFIEVTNVKQMVGGEVQLVQDEDVVRMFRGMPTEVSRYFRDLDGIDVDVVTVLIRQPGC